MTPQERSNPDLLAKVRATHHPSQKRCASWLLPRPESPSFPFCCLHSRLPLGTRASHDCNCQCGIRAFDAPRLQG
jgi:hypothetical protein